MGTVDDDLLPPPPPKRKASVDDGFLLPPPPAKKKKSSDIGFPSGSNLLQNGGVNSLVSQEPTDLAPVLLLKR